MPGDPARAILGLSAEESRLEELRTELGLDQSIGKQYWQSIAGIFSKSKPLKSLRFDQPVLKLVAESLPLSAAISIYSFLLIMLLALPLALLSAYYAHRWPDYLGAIWTRINQSIPPFFMALLLSLIAANFFRYFQPAYYPAAAGLGTRLRVLFLPALAIALPRLAQAYQFLRDALVAEWSKDYVLCARSQGASRWRILLTEILPNALIPFITASGLILAEIISNTLLIEQVFKLPGLGQLLFSAVAQRDFPLAQTILLLLAVFIISINRLVDLSNRSLDPRLSWRKRSSAPVTLTISQGDKQ